MKVNFHIKLLNSICSYSLPIIIFVGMFALVVCWLYGVADYTRETKSLKLRDLMLSYLCKVNLTELSRSTLLNNNVRCTLHKCNKGAIQDKIAEKG